MRNVANSVDEYIAAFPPEIQASLQAVRQAIREAAPQAEERISYGIPGYKLNGVLVYFAAHKKHLGFYPAGTAIKTFQAELSAYKTSKGAVQFPFDQPLPLDLIDKIARFRVSENMNKVKK
jgi:uncharacterized protein YdhG (YjbR/CyaY superfamily)